MSKFKKKDSVIVAGGVYKPLISASLAIALGVSVASGVGTNNVINSNTVIQSTGGGDITIPDTNFASDDSSVAGLLIKAGSTPINLDFRNNLIMNNKTEGTKNAYGILLASGSANFLGGDSFKSVVVKGVTASGGGKEAYIFKNTGGIATFENVGIFAGASASASGDHYGIHSEIANAKYAFGSDASKTVFKGTGVTKPFAAIVMADSAELGGNAEVVGAKGADAATSTDGVGLGNADGGKGQDVVGIQATKAGASTITIADGGLNLKLIGGDGGNGNSAKGGVNGKGGSATGILIDSAVNAKTTIFGGSIALSLQAGKRGSSATAPDADATLYAIKNSGSNELAITNSILVGESRVYDGDYALFSNTQGVKYDFGNSDNSQAGAKTTLAITGTSPSASGPGDNATGVVVTQNTVFAGVLGVTATGGAANLAGKGGDGIGLNVWNKATLSFEEGKTNSLTLVVDGGTKVGSVANGDAIGIKLESATLDASNATLTLHVGNDGKASPTTKNATNAIALDLTNSTFSGTFTANSTNMIGSDSATSATLIKNAGNSTIASGVIRLESADGLKVKSPDGTTNIIDNSSENAGVLTFGNLDGKKHATLLLGTKPNDANKIPVSDYQAGLIVNLASQKINFGTGEGKKTIFNVSDNTNDAYGAFLKTATELSGNLELNTITSASNKKSVGIYSETNQAFLGNIVINADSTNTADSIGFATKGVQALTFAEATNDSAANTIAINSDSTSDAVGILVAGGKLTIQDNHTGVANKLGFSRFALNVGTQKAENAMGLALIENGAIDGDIMIASGKIGHEKVGRAVAIYVNENGVLDGSTQSVSVADGILNGSNKHVIVSAKDLTFTSGHTITGGSAADVTDAYGLYNSIAEGIYSFEGTNGASFTVTGAQGAAATRAATNGENASAVIINADTAINGKLTVSATGGAAQADNMNGGNAIGIDVRSGSLVFGNAKTKVIAITADGGAKHGGTGKDGKVAAIKLASGTSLNTMGYTLDLHAGNTKAEEVIALDMNTASFAGSFTADSTNVIGNASVTSATLIKNVGDSAITFGDIKLAGNTGLVGKTTKILDNSGVLTFGTLGSEGEDAINASLTVGTPSASLFVASDANKANIYGFANSIDGESVDFGSVDGSKTIFNVTAENTANKVNAAGAILSENTTFRGKVEFNVNGGYNLTTTGSSAGIAVDATSDKTLTLDNASITLNVDTHSANNGAEAYGVYVAGGKFKIDGAGSLKFNIGSSNAKEAYGFYVGTTGILDAQLIDFSNANFAKIGNENATVATAVHIGTSAGAQTGFSLTVAEGVLSGEKKYILNNEGDNATKLTFANNGTTSQRIIAGDASSVQDAFGIYSGIEDVSYNFGATNGSVFNVASDSNAYGAIIAKNAVFEGKATLGVTSNNGNAAAIRLDGTSTYAGAFDLTNSTVKASKEAVALLATGTHIVNDSITVGTNVLDGTTNYVFKNTGASTTFNGSLIAGTPNASGGALIGLDSNIANANYDFGTQTIFNTGFASTSAGSNSATGAMLKANTNFAGNVVFNVEGQSDGTAGAGIGLDANTNAVVLTLAPSSSVAFNVDSGAGSNGVATGIQVKDEKLTIQDAESNVLDTSNFIFNVGAKNATTAKGIDIQAAGSIAGDLVIAKGKIGNASAEAIGVNVTGTGTITEQSIILADGVLSGNTNYVYKNASSVAIDFKNGVKGVGQDILDDSITAGDASKVAEAYGLYSGIKDIGYDFGVNKTTFTVNSENDAVGAIIAKDAFFTNKADFIVDGANAVGLWVKDSILSFSDATSGTADMTLTVGANAQNATAIKLDNAELYTAEKGATFSVATIGNATATSSTALATSGISRVNGKGIIFNDTLAGGKDTQKLYLDNSGDLTFDRAELVIANAGGAFTADTAARVGLNNSQKDARFEFGNNEAKTTFIVRGDTLSENGATKVAGANAIAANLAADTIFGGNVVFDVQGGIHTNTSSGTVQTIGSGTGFNIASATNLTLAPNSNVGLRIDSANGTDGVATGINVDNVAFNVLDGEGSSLGSSAFVFNVGNAYATTAKAINLTQAGAKLAGDSIVIKSGSVIGNTDYTTTATAIHLDNSATITNQSIVVEEGVSFLTKKDANSKRYILNNAANTKLSFSNDANKASGNHTITVGQVEKDAGTYGLYSNIADVSYNFGTTPAEFSVKGKDGVSQGEAAAGLVLGASARFEGKANFSVVGGSSSEGVGGNAYGIQAIGGDTTLAVAENAALTFDIAGGEGASQKGKSVGILASNGTLTIAKEGNGSGTVSFGVGDYSQNQSAGVELDHGVFDGSVTFSAVKAKDVAYGILNDSESIIKNGEISFADQAFKDVGTWSVIENQGTLTIGRNATITAGTNSASIKAALFNGIDKATYNLGRLNLEAGSGKDFAIYSANDTSVFNVASGSNVDISAVNSKDTKAFGGSINLNLEGGKATNIYLNTDGGNIKNLVASSNATIYLSGTSKSRRVGGASKIDYRTLSIDLMSANPSKSRAAATEIQRGANFVVLVDSDRKNGTTKNALTGAVTNRGTGAAYGIDGNASLAGGSDRIIISYDVANMPSVSAIDSGLGVGISSLNTSGEKKYAVLAQVANDYTNITNQDGDNTRLHNLVTFNGLTKDGDVALVTSNVGFDVATIAIERHDLGTQEQVDLSSSNGENWSNVGAVYVSDMIARSASVDADVANSTISAINTNFDLVSANLNSLSKRLGELRNTDNAHGLWGRVFAGQQTSKFGIEQTSTYLTFQAGYDYKLALENANNYVGFALSYVHSSSKQASAEFLADANGLNKIAGNATSTSDGVELAVYNTYVADNGLYSDSIVKFGYFSSDLNIPAQADTYGVDNLAVAISEEVGYKVSLGEQNEWFITPQAELAYAFINGSEFTQYIGSASLNTKQDAISMLRTRIGAAWGYNFDHYGKDKGIKASLYLGTYYAYDAIMGGKTNMLTSNGTAQEFSNLESNGRFVLNVGTDVAVQDSTKFYVDFEKSFGNMMQTDYQVSVGVRYSFGSTSTKKDKKASESVLKPKELQKAE